jgi:hypothetical protein
MSAIHRRAVLVLALFGFGALADACRQHAIAVIPTPPPQGLRYILAAGADNADAFCVPTTLEAGTDPSEVFPLRCTTVGDIRRYVRGQRMAE